MKNKYIIYNNLNLKSYSLDYFLLNLLKSRIHIGSNQKRFNNELSFYLYGLRGSKYIFNIKWVILLLNRALNFIYQIIIRKGSFLIINNIKDNNINNLLQKFSKTYGYQLIDYKWIGGLLTNSNIRSLNQPLKERDKNTIIIKNKQPAHFFNINYYYNLMNNNFLYPFQCFDNISYKSNSTNNFNYVPFGNNLNKFFNNNFNSYNSISSKFIEQVLYNKINLKKIDSILLFTDSINQHDIISEISSLNIPVISICNSNLNTGNINYLIPGNNVSIYSINIYLKLLKQVIKKGELFLKFVKSKNFY